MSAKRSLFCSILLGTVVLHLVMSARGGAQEFPKTGVRSSATVHDYRPDSMVIDSGMLSVTLPARLCASTHHVGDTLVVPVWRPYWPPITPEGVYSDEIPDSTFPQGITAPVMISGFQLGSDVAQLVSFSVLRVRLGNLSDAAPGFRFYFDPERASVGLRAQGGEAQPIDVCYQDGALDGKTTRRIVLRRERNSSFP